MVWSGRCLTAGISASPNPAKGCILSDILMCDAGEKYFLSPKQQERLLNKSLQAARADGFYSAEGVSCTLTAQTGGMGGKTGLYALPCCVDLNESPEFTQYARCLIAKQDGGIHHHKREASGVWDGCRIRRLTPRECLRLQGWKDERIDLILSLHSDTQLYKQAGNGVTVNVVEAIGKRLTALHREVTAID